MADFNLFHPKVLRLEGGYQCQKPDTGNYDTSGRLIGTKCGIGAQTLQTYYLKFKGIDILKLPIEDVINIMKNLTPEQAVFICKNLFWDVCRADNIKNQSIAEMLVDWFWGSGYYGLKWEQGCLKVLGLNITPDYKITPDEIAAINNYFDQQGLWNYLKQERINYCNWLCNNNPEYDKMGYRQGWINRINSFTYST